MPTSLSTYPFHSPLDTVKSAGGGVASGRVVAAHGIQKAVTHGHTHAATPTVHGAGQRPLVGVWVETLDGLQARAAITATDSVQSGGQGKVSI